ncbi:hypothetical protein [Streptomyces himalayensis]|uniref:Uncharacterized protein n=1 Tax=Streptomyces himalayensis subsp. himalayensis TaxID=2756131 RepID=A0A7W0DQR1_9ACTN|nr:hypothetical protein [Streptomyces himalayensis]MBA2949526.1 hypothetical protein [Streptomyces himalayensis subsp. himalayensis]
MGAPTCRAPGALCGGRCSPGTHVEASCREWLAHPGQFVPAEIGSRPLPTAGTADGEAEPSIQQVAARLGILPAAIIYQIRAGRLAARHRSNGRVAIP